MTRYIKFGCNFLTLQYKHLLLTHHFIKEPMQDLKINSTSPQKKQPLTGKKLAHLFEVVNFVGILIKRFLFLFIITTNLCHVSF